MAGDVDRSLADARMYRIESGDGAGIDLATAGDVNGDGFDDILIDADGMDNGSELGAGLGT